MAPSIAFLFGVLGGLPASYYFNYLSKFAGTSQGFGYTLPVVYVTGLVVLMMLNPISSWFARIKRERRDGSLSYL